MYTLAHSSTMALKRGALSTQDVREPAWRHDLAFRGQPYRLLGHQYGVQGHFHVRILNTYDLPSEALGRFSPPRVGNAAGGDWLPSIALGMGRDWRRASARPALAGVINWARDPLTLELLKDSVAAGGGDKGAALEVQVFNRQVVPTVLAEQQKVFASTSTQNLAQQQQLSRPAWHAQQSRPCIARDYAQLTCAMLAMMPFVVHQHTEINAA
jgi:hypothetical protein